MGLTEDCPPIINRRPSLSEHWALPEMGEKEELGEGEREVEVDPARSDHPRPSLVSHTSREERRKEGKNQQRRMRRKKWGKGG